MIYINLHNQNDSLLKSYFLGFFFFLHHLGLTETLFINSCHMKNNINSLEATLHCLEESISTVATSSVLKCNLVLHHSRSTLTSLLGILVLQLEPEPHGMGKHSVSQREQTGLSANSLSELSFCCFRFQSISFNFHR